jgi:hypothetical protein
LISSPHALLFASQLKKRKQQARVSLTISNRISQAFYYFTTKKIDIDQRCQNHLKGCINEKRRCFMENVDFKEGYIEAIRVVSRKLEAEIAQIQKKREKSLSDLTRLRAFMSAYSLVWQNNNLLEQKGC